MVRVGVIVIVGVILILIVIVIVMLILILIVTTIGFRKGGYMGVCVISESCLYGCRYKSRPWRILCENYTPGTTMMVENCRSVCGDEC